jgi:hypothetical protein
LPPLLLHKLGKLNHVPLVLFLSLQMLHLEHKFMPIQIHQIG